MTEAAYYAKNRYALLDSLPLSWDALSDIITASIPKGNSIANMTGFFGNADPRKLDEPQASTAADHYSTVRQAETQRKTAPAA